MAKRIGNEIRVGLVGLGVVGSGVARLMLALADHVGELVGAPVALEKVALRDRNKKRSVEIDQARITTDPFELVDSGQIEILVELMGGSDIALELMSRALARGISVVTANKAALAIDGERLYDLARANNASILFEGAIGGSIPIARALTTSFASETIDAVYGIVNGTSNYILSRMTESVGSSYEEILKEARALGFAEADPTFDVEGIDAAHKIALLASMAFKTPVDFDKITVEGITKIGAIDIEMAREFGAKIKLIAMARRVDEETISARVTPALIDSEQPIAKIDGALNAIEIIGKDIGVNMLVGPGAGEGPTASVVMGDIIDVARSIASTGAAAARSGVIRSAARRALKFLPSDQARARFYIRFQTPDRPGVLVSLLKPLAERGISIASMIQRGDSDPVSIVLTTHDSGALALRAALDEIAASAPIASEPVVLELIDAPLG